MCASLHESLRPLEAAADISDGWLAGGWTRAGFSRQKRKGTSAASAGAARAGSWWVPHLRLAPLTCRGGLPSACTLAGQRLRSVVWGGSWQPVNTSNWEPQAVGSTFTGALEVIDLASSAQQDQVVHQVHQFPFRISACRFLPGGQHLVCGGRDGPLLLLDLTTGLQLHRVDVHRSCITSMSFSQQAQLLAAGDELGLVSAWDLSGQSFSMVQLCR